MSTSPIHLHTESIVPPRYSTDFPRPVAATLEKQAGDDDATPVRGNEPHLASALSLDLPTPAADFPHSDYRYKPTFEIDQNHNVISHDSVLNSSPVALLRFIQEHTASPPTVTISIRGLRGKADTPRLFRTCDFSFSVVASPDPTSTGEAYAPLLYTMGNWELACRGKTVYHESADGDPRCQVPAGAAPKRTVSQHWREDMLKERAARGKNGLPGFINPASFVEMGTKSVMGHPPVLLQSYVVDLFDAHSPTAVQTPPVSVQYEALARERVNREDEVRLAVEAYCSSRSSLKELTIVKETYGYNWNVLSAAIRAKVLEAWELADTAGGEVQVEVHTNPQTITIRPNNALAGSFSETYVNKILLSACLAYPIICVAEALLGARFDHIRSSSPLVRWKLLPAPASDADALTEQTALALAVTLDSRPPKVAVLPTGQWVYLVGTEEGEWLHKWEGAIADAVKGKKRGGAVLTLGEVVEEAAPALRGY